MKVTAIVPAYNEEKTIGEVVRTVARHPRVHRVIVVDDGSNDATSLAARKNGADVIRLERNRGKGGAMKAGLDEVDADIVLFLDADLVGLKPRHVDELLEPVMRGESQMTIGRFAGGRPATDFAQTVMPFLSGQRAVSRQMLKAIPDMEISRFGVELALTKHVKKHDVAYKEVILKDLSHRMKEEKMGFWRGMAARARMYGEIMASVFRS